MLYEDNLSVLKSKYKRVYDAIGMGLDVSISDKISVEDARKAGQVVVFHIRGRDIYLNSKYDSENEANKYMAEYFDMPDESILFMYGLSNGSYVREFIRNTKKNVKCIVYEPCVEVFMQVIKNINIKDILESDRVHIVVKGINDEDFSLTVGQWLQFYNKDTNKIIEAPKYIDLFNEKYTLFIQEIKELYEKFYICSYTDIEFGKTYVTNGLRNMEFLAGCRSGMVLKGKFPEDMTAVVVSSGPSLEKNVALLKDIKGKAFIFATDSAVQQILNIGIKPDAMISIDPNKSVNLFKADGIEDIPFFVEMYANTEVLKYVKARNLYFFSSDSVVWSRLFEKAGSEILSIGTGGSVATAAIANLILWGFKRIVLIGQDLAFTGNRMHAGEDAIEISEDDNRFMTITDINGNDVWIKKDYYVYLKWIENVALRYSDIEFIDATEGGARKKNLKQMTFREVIDKYCTSEYGNILDILLSSPRLFMRKDIQLVWDALENMKHNFENMQERLLACRDDCVKGKAILESGKFDIDELKRINTNIKNTDELIEDSDEIAYLKKYIAESEADMMSDMYQEEKDDIKESIRMYEKSRKYYDSLIKVLPELIDLVGDIILQVKGERVC
ncbi:MAG: motility associated factor glycosyltransferase family protein [Lachnospiraceae bacterium]|nr:motility associated factor glycosyltransferase family protein [Lachnospiraceae bacterium]